MSDKYSQKHLPASTHQSGISLLWGTKAEISEQSCVSIRYLSDHALENKQLYCVGISGGSLPALMKAGASQEWKDMDFSHWRLFFTDERCVSLDHADSNFLGVKKALLEYLPQFPMDNVFPYSDSLQTDPQAAAIAYEKLIREIVPNVNNIPIFDLLLLGMGPDGHTCSLFPGHALLDETKALIAPIMDSPKPPSARITMTYPLVNAAKRSIIISCGASKVDMLQRIHSGLDKLATPPIARVQTRNVMWYVDDQAMPVEKRVKHANVIHDLITTDKVLDVAVWSL